jgi:hypothetical protein
VEGNTAPFLLSCCGARTVKSVKKCMFFSIKINSRIFLCTSMRCAFSLLSHHKIFVISSANLMVFSSFFSPFFDHKSRN